MRDIADIYCMQNWIGKRGSLIVAHRKRQIACGEGMDADEADLLAQKLRGTLTRALGTPFPQTSQIPTA